MDSAFCKKCDPKGLKILPALYAVFPTSIPTQLPDGISGKGVADVALEAKHHYGLRIMREGYLYLIYSKGPHGKNYPQAYRVHSDATVTPLPLPAPLVSLPEPSCARVGHPVSASTIVIERPHECGEVFIAFSEHRWSDDTLKFYLNLKNMPARRKRMQAFEPASWVAGGSYEHATEPYEPNIECIYEYANARKTSNPLEVSRALTFNISQPTGLADASRLDLETTRYPVHVRWPLAWDMSNFMHGPSAVDTSDHDKPCRPMLLALWDGIGIAHELNGFRNDAGSMLQLYVQERALQLDAVQCIRAAHQAKIASAEVTEVGTNPNAEIYFKKLNAARVGRAKDIWNNHYQPRIVQAKLDKFEANFQQFQQDIEKIQAARSADVAAWLKAPVFLATLQDYNEHNLQDGVAFAGVIAEAIYGLPSEAVGLQVVLDLLNLTDPTQAPSIIWRAYAYNQKSVKTEIKELLAKVVAGKAEPMSATGSAWAAFSTGVDGLKAYAALREQVAEIQRHKAPVSASERFVKDHHIDRLAVTLGDPLFKWLGIDKLGDTVGAALVKASLMLRIGVSHADVVDLVKGEAKVNPALWHQLAVIYKRNRVGGLPPAEAYTTALQDLAADDGTQLLRAKWTAVSKSLQGDDLDFGVRIGGVLAIIELFNFGSLLAKTDKTGEDYAMLVASGFSAMGACLIGSTKVMTALAKDAAQTLSNLKAITGYFGGIAAGIGAVLDYETARSELGKGNIGIFALYFSKTVIEAGVTAAYLLTALTYSAPLIARITAGRSVAFLGRVGAGIRGATAASGALAETAGDAAARQLAARAAANVAFDAAAEEAGVVISERAALLLLGRAVLFLAGWEVGLVVLVIQVMIWVFKDNDLQKWLDDCWFGVDQLYTDAAQQHRAFEQALQAVGLQADEAAA